MKRPKLTVSSALAVIDRTRKVLPHSRERDSSYARARQLYQESQRLILESESASRAGNKDEAQQLSMKAADIQRHKDSAIIAAESAIAQLKRLAHPTSGEAITLPSRAMRREAARVLKREERSAPQ